MCVISELLSFLSSLLTLSPAYSLLLLTCSVPSIDLYSVVIRSVQQSMNDPTQNLPNSSSTLHILVAFSTNWQFHQYIRSNTLPHRTQRYLSLSIHQRIMLHYPHQSHIIPMVSFRSRQDSIQFVNLFGATLMLSLLRWCLWSKSNVGDFGEECVFVICIVARVIIVVVVCCC